MRDGAGRTAGLRSGYAKMRWVSRTYKLLRETLTDSSCGTGPTNAVADKFVSHQCRLRQRVEEDG